MKLTGAPELLKLLDGLSRRGASAIGRKSVTYGNKVLVRGMKARVPAQTKILRKSLAQRVKTYRHGGMTTGIVGPKIEAAQVVLLNGRPVVRDPRHYAHLVEYGHEGVAPRSFIRATAIEDGARVAAAMEAGAKEALAKELARGS